MSPSSVQHIFVSGAAPATPAVNDLELITRIKTLNDSAAVTELVHRHTGAYMSVIQQYEGYSDFRAKANIPDLRDDKFLNIYRFALKYDPLRASEADKDNPFGRHVFEQTRYMCRTLISRGSVNGSGCGTRLDGVELNEATSPSNDTPVMDTVEKDSVFDAVRDGVAATKDPLFQRIFKLRHGGKKAMTWRAVAKKVGMTHEGARKAYNKHMGMIKEQART